MPKADLPPVKTRATVINIFRAYDSHKDNGYFSK